MTVEPVLDTLLQATRLFFQRHWNLDLLGEPPVWSDIFSDLCAFPNFDKHGVYAFVTAEKVVTYIGSGTSQHKDNEALGARIATYRRWDKSQTGKKTGIHYY